MQRIPVVRTIKMVSCLNSPCDFETRFTDKTQRHSGSVSLASIANYKMSFFFFAVLNGQADYNSWAMHLGSIAADHVEYGTVESGPGVGGGGCDGYQDEDRKTTCFPQFCSVLGSHYREMSFQ